MNNEETLTLSLDEIIKRRGVVGRGRGRGSGVGRGRGARGGGVGRGRGGGRWRGRGRYQVYYRKRIPQYNQQRGMRGQQRGMRSQQRGMRSQQRGMRRQQRGMRSRGRNQYTGQSPLTRFRTYKNDAMDVIQRLNSGSKLRMNQQRYVKNRVRQAAQILNRRGQQRYANRIQRGYNGASNSIGYHSRGRLNSRTRDMAVGSFRSDHLMKLQRMQKFRQKAMKAEISSRLSQQDTGRGLTVSIPNDMMITPQQTPRTPNLQSNFMNSTSRFGGSHFSPTFTVCSENHSVVGASSSRGLNPLLQQEIAAIQGKHVSTALDNVGVLNAFRPTPGTTKSTLNERFSL